MTSTWDVFQRAYDSDDPIELNRVKAVERGVDQLYNYIVELAALGLELAEVRCRRPETNATVDIDSLERIGVIGPVRAAKPAAAAGVAPADGARGRDRDRRAGA